MSLKAVKYRWKYERKLSGLPQHNTHVLQPLENACPMREECSCLDSPLFQWKHCKTEGLCNFPRCVEQNCFRYLCCLRCIMSRDYAFLWRRRSRREVCRCATVEPSSCTTATIPPTVTTAKTIASRCSLRAWLVVTSGQTETLPTPQSQFQTQRKMSASRNIAARGTPNVKDSLLAPGKRCRQRKRRKRHTSVRLT